MNVFNTVIQRALLLACLLLISNLSNAKSHPSYLSDKYCSDVVEQFVNTGMRSLDKYINEHFNPEYKGGIRNTIQFLEQRLDWLNECNSYLTDTTQSSVFHNKGDTQKIFNAIKELAKELQHVRSGVEYQDESGNNDPSPFIKRRYQTLAQLVDRHHTRMLMKKQFQ
ncbi:hypothetical protein MO867_02885 [Microbulbifer sp. OS29]|uniref:Uncharacterized protein n=1 Tax=Microbulbifer okhotskensis TaxID=2926617 RepID=A0A9X2EJA4_9GAMM|nr:hypothetical protein [Microbulbifer okhotskensis]MCO1333277.1 hypothetical protein [Microbulbifer okhotskensis]